jgi:hypothetical protein
MGLVAEQNLLNQRARPLVNAKGFTKIVRRRSQDKARENTIKKRSSIIDRGGLKNDDMNLRREGYHTQEKRFGTGHSSCFKSLKPN